MPIYNVSNGIQTALTTPAGVALLETFVKSTYGAQTFKVRKDRRDELRALIDGERRSSGGMSALAARGFSFDLANGFASTRHTSGVQSIWDDVVSKFGVPGSLCSSRILPLTVVATRINLVRSFAGVAHVLSLLEAVYPDFSALTYDAWVGVGNAAPEADDETDYTPDYYPMSEFSVSKVERGVTISIQHSDWSRVSSFPGGTYGYESIEDADFLSQIRRADLPVSLSANILFTPNPTFCPTEADMSLVIRGFLSALEEKFTVECGASEKGDGLQLNVPVTATDFSTLERLGIRPQEGAEDTYVFAPSRNLFEAVTT